MSTDTLDRLLTTLAVRIHAFALCEVAPGWRLAFDPMDGITIHYVLAGTGTIAVGADIVAAFAPFSIVVVPAGVRQTLGDGPPSAEANAAEHCGLLADGLIRFTVGPRGAGTVFVCATLSASYAGALGLFEHLPGPVVADLSGNEAVRRLFHALLAEIATPGLGTQAMTECLMKQCLILLLRTQLAQLSIRSPFFSVLHDDRLARVVASVLEQPALPRTVDSLAELAGMSRSVFAARFVAVFGYTPIDFVQRVRLRLAADLLASTGLPIKLIAATVGYASRSYFSRAFRAAHGTDPREFRARAARGAQVLSGAPEPSLADRMVAGIDRLFDPAS